MALWRDFPSSSALLAAAVLHDFSHQPLNPYDAIASGVNSKILPTVGGVAMPDVGMNLPIYMGVTNEGMYLGQDLDF